MRQLTAIMFTDIVGFTSLMQEDEARAKAVVLRHRESVTRSVEAHQGELLQFYGDGTLSVFKSAVQAVECAIALKGRSEDVRDIGRQLEVDTVVEVDPLSLVNLIRLARSYSLANRFDDGLSATEKALEFSPSFCPAIEISGHVLVGMGRLDEAIEMFESLPRLGHDRFEGAGGRGYAYALAGRTDEDRAMVPLLEQKMREQPDMAPHYDLAMVHVGLRNDDDAVACLENAVESRTGPVLWIPVEPHWRPLRPHPGFQQILQAVGR